MLSSVQSQRSCPVNPISVRHHDSQSLHEESNIIEHQPDNVLERVMHPLEGIRRRWIDKQYITTNLSPLRISKPDTTPLPALPAPMANSLNEWRSVPLRVEWSEISELSYSFEITLEELLQLFTDGSIVGSVMPYILFGNTDYLECLLGALKIPKNEIHMLRSVLEKYPHPIPNDLDIRRVTARASDAFLFAVRKLLASKFPQNFALSNRDALVRFLTQQNHGRQINESPENLLLLFIHYTAFNKNGQPLFRQNCSFQVTQLKATTKPNFLPDHIPPLPLEFIDAGPLTMPQLWRSSFSLPLDKKEFIPEGEQHWRGILQLLFGIRELVKPEAVETDELGNYVVNATKGLCDGTLTDVEAIRKTTNSTGVIAQVLARKIATTLKGRQSALVPLLHSAIQALSEGNSPIPADKLWAETMRYCMTPPEDSGLKPIAPSVWKEVIAAQPTEEGVILSAVSCEGVHPKVATSLLGLDTFLKLFSHDPSGLSLREHRQRWNILRNMHSDSILVPLDPSSSFDEVCLALNDSRTGDILLKLLRQNPPPPLLALTNNSLHRFTVEHAITPEELAKRALPLTKASSPALRYLGVRYLCLALLMGPAKEKVRDKISNHLFEAIPCTLDGLTDAHLIEPLLSDLETVLPLCGHGALVDLNKDSTLSLSRLRQVVNHPKKLTNAWLLTLAESSVDKHRNAAQQLCLALQSDNKIHDHATIETIKTLHRQDPVLALSLLRRSETSKHLTPDQCVALLPTLKSGSQSESFISTAKNLIQKLIDVGNYTQTMVSLVLFQTRSEERLTLWDKLIRKQISEKHWQDVMCTLQEGHPQGKKALLESGIYHEAFRSLVNYDLAKALELLEYYPKTPETLIQPLFKFISSCHDPALVQRAEQWLVSQTTIKDPKIYWKDIISAWKTIDPQRLLDSLQGGPQDSELIDHVLLCSTQHIEEGDLKTYRLFEPVLRSFNVPFALNRALLKHQPRQALEQFIHLLSAHNPEENGEEITKSLILFADYLKSQDKATLNQLEAVINNLWTQASKLPQGKELLGTADILADAGLTAYLPSMMALLSAQKITFKVKSISLGVQLEAKQFLDKQAADSTPEDAKKILAYLTHKDVNIYFESDEKQRSLWRRCLEIEFAQVLKDFVKINKDPSGSYEGHILERVEGIRKQICVEKITLRNQIQQEFIAKVLQSDIGPTTYSCFTTDLEALIQSHRKGPLDPALKQIIMRYFELSAAYPIEPAVGNNLFSLLTPKHFHKDEFSILHLIQNGSLPEAKFSLGSLNAIAHKLVPLMVSYGTPASILAAAKALEKLAGTGASTSKLVESLVTYIDAHPTCGIYRHRSSLVILAGLDNNFPPEDQNLESSRKLINRMREQGDKLIDGECDKQDQLDEIDRIFEAVVNTLKRCFLQQEYVKGANVWNDLPPLQILMMYGCLRNSSNIHMYTNLLRQLSDPLPSDADKIVKCSDLWNDWIIYLATTTTKPEFHDRAQQYFEEALSRNILQSSPDRYAITRQRIESLPSPKDFPSMLVSCVVDATNGLYHNAPSGTLPNDDAAQKIAEKLVRAIQHKYNGEWASIAPLFINLCSVIDPDLQSHILTDIWNLTLTSLVRSQPVEKCLKAAPLADDEIETVVNALDPIYQTLFSAIIKGEITLKVGLAFLQHSLCLRVLCPDGDNPRKFSLENRSIVGHRLKGGISVIPFLPLMGFEWLAEAEKQPTRLPHDLLSALLANQILSNELTADQDLSPQELSEAATLLLQSDLWPLRYLAVRWACLAAKLDPQQAPVSLELILAIPLLLTDPIDPQLLTPLLAEIKDVFPMNWDEVSAAIPDFQKVFFAWLRALAQSEDENLRSATPVCWDKLLEIGWSIDEMTKSNISHLTSTHPFMSIILLEKAWDTKKLSPKICSELVDQIEKNLNGSPLINYFTHETSSKHCVMKLLRQT